MMQAIGVLGAGRVGRVIALDLSARHEVTAIDCLRERLDEGFPQNSVRTLQIDFSQAADFADILSRFDLIVNALPGHLGRRVLELAIEARRPVVDISFAPENLLELDALAHRQGVTVVVDMGLAPGMSNVLLGHHIAELETVDRFECLVGGLPVERTRPFEYKAPFSPADVIEEYTRPARLREKGNDIVRPALSEIEPVEFPGIGTLEAFNTDGLRSLLQSYDVPNMREKTLRYPGHARRMQMLRDAGFFSVSPIEVGGVPVRPLDVTSRLLFEHWQLEEDDPEFTVMRVTVEGSNAEGGHEVHAWSLEDHRDRSTGFSSMARTTGFACSAAVELLCRHRFRRPGVHPPERLGEDSELFQSLLEYQAERGIEYRHALAGSTAS